MIDIQRGVEGLMQTLSGESVQVPDIVDAELYCVRLVVTAALTKRDGTVGKAICHVCDGSPF